MTENKLEAVKKVLCDIYDVMDLAVEEGKIYNKMACGMTEGICSLDSDSSEGERCNAHLLVYHSDELNLINCELFKRFRTFSKMLEVYTAVLDDLDSDNDACSSVSLFEKYFGGDND